MTKELIERANEVYAKWCDEKHNQTTVMQLTIEALNVGYLAGLEAAKGKCGELAASEDRMLTNSTGRAGHLQRMFGHQDCEHAIAQLIKEQQQ